LEEGGEFLNLPAADLSVQILAFPKSCIPNLKLPGSRKDLHLDKGKN